jgi:hypothetical protein
MALATGFFGGFGHCAVMCGPVVGAFALVSGPLGQRRSMARQVAYHAGRLTTYAVLGGLFGLAGSFVDLAGRLAGFAHIMAVAAGVTMILLGMGAAGAAKAFRQLEARASQKVVSLVTGLLKGGAGGLFPVGLALGFLPCGLSYTMFLGSAGTGRLAEGFLLALAFGIGTVPALLVAGALAGLYGARARGLLYRLGGGLVAAMGVLFLWRGP